MNYQHKTITAGDMQYILNMDIIIAALSDSLGVPSQSARHALLELIGPDADRVLLSEADSRELER